MDFARKELEKYGWREGKGLGKQEDGIKSAIKPKLKYDTTGVGHEIGKDFTNKWWENVYNSASNNIEVEKKKGDVRMSVVNGESIEISTKDYNMKDFKKKNSSMEYGTFLKTAKLTENGTLNYDVSAPEENVFKIATLTDEELLAACNGRTAHKGARHGLKLSGKLSRIEKQEKLLLKQLQKVSLKDEDNTKTEKKLKKLNKHKDKSHDKDETLDLSTKKKKRKKKRKSVSFNETITEYHIQDLDTSSQSNESLEAPIILKSKIRDGFEEINAQDEGIEQDCDMKSGDLSQQCFEQVQKTKKEKKKKRATAKFLEEIIESNELPEKFKRKHEDEDFEAEQEEIISKKRCEDVCSKSMKKKRKKKRRAEKKAINSIVASLDQVCKISDTE